MGAPLGSKPVELPRWAKESCRRGRRFNTEFFKRSAARVERSLCAIAVTGGKTGTDREAMCWLRVLVSTDRDFNDAMRFVVATRGYEKFSRSDCTGSESRLKRCSEGFSPVFARDIVEVLPVPERNCFEQVAQFNGRRPVACGDRGAV